MEQLCKFLSLLRFFQLLFLLSLPLRGLLQRMLTLTFYSIIVDECFFFVTTKTSNVLCLTHSRVENFMEDFCRISETFNGCVVSGTLKTSAVGTPLFCRMRSNTQKQLTAQDRQLHKNWATCIKEMSKRCYRECT